MATDRADRGFRDPPRLAAYDVLRAVDADDAYANLVLPRLLRERELSGRDAALATELVGGTLRGLGTYDAILDSLTSRAPDPAVRDALRLGAHQLLAMRVPSHAAVASSVDLVRHRVGHKPTGFVNAVLRKVAAHDLAGWVRRLAPDPDTDPTGYLALAHSHPRWVVDALSEALGRPEELDALLAADNERPAVSLVARPGLAGVDELGGRPGPSPVGVVLDGGDPGAVPAVREGRAGVQDPGSQLVALALAPAPRSTAPTTAGSTCARAREARPRCSRPWPPSGGPGCWPPSASRTGPPWSPGPCRASAAGAVAVVTADGTRPAWPRAGFDRVLVDAPCTGLGRPATATGGPLAADARTT